MNCFCKASSLFLTIVALLFLGGCAEQASIEIIDEEDEPTYRRAKELIARGKQNEALENFIKLIGKRDGDAPESHLEAGNIYLYHIKDPITAIYHFKRYQAIQGRRANDPQVRQKLSLVDDLVKTSMKAFASTFDAKVYQDPLERLKLLETIEQLRDENESLKRSLAKERSKTPAARPLTRQESATIDVPVASTEPAPARPAAVEPTRPTEPVENPAPARTYTVQSGDTLYTISKKVYGNGGRWRDILDANRDAIPNQNQLRVGAELRIP